MRIRNVIKLVGGAGLLAVVIYGMTQAESLTRRSDGVIRDEGDGPLPLSGRRQVGDASEILQKERSPHRDPLS